jgi:hypothetical protein
LFLSGHVELEDGDGVVQVIDVGCHAIGGELEDEVVGARCVEVEGSHDAG